MFPALLRSAPGGFNFISGGWTWRTSLGLDPVQAWTCWLLAQLSAPLRSELFKYQVTGGRLAASVIITEIFLVIPSAPVHRTYKYIQERQSEKKRNCLLISWQSRYYVKCMWRNATKSRGLRVHMTWLGENNTAPHHSVYFCLSSSVGRSLCIKISENVFKILCHPSALSCGLQRPQHRGCFTVRRPIRSQSILR